MKLISALKFRNYQIFIAGQALSNIGNLMQQVAVSWLAYQMTDSAFILGIVTFSKQMAAFFTGLFAGVVADRFNKKKVVQLAQLMIGLASLLLTLVTWWELTTIVFLIGVQLFMGLMKGMEMPCRQALVNDILPDKKYLVNAIALNSTVFNTARVVGPGVAGLLIPVAGELMCFFIYGVLSFIIVFTLFFVKTFTNQKKNSHLDFKAEFLEGANYAFGFPTIKLSILFVGAFTLVGVSFIVLLPLLTDVVFNAGSEVFGYMNSALGLGAIVGGVFLANRSKADGIQRFIFMAAAIFSVSLVVVSFSQLLVLTLIAIAFTGLGRVVIFAGTNTLLQTVSEEDKRGRVLSLYIAMFMASVTIGGLLVGALADWIGVIPTLFLEGCLCLVISLVYLSQMKSIVVPQREAPDAMDVAKKGTDHFSKAS
ncbi:MAG: MFS transporter [Bacteroidota bacterium]